MTTRSEYKIPPPLSLSLSLCHSALPPIVLPCEIILVRGCASHESYTQAKVASAGGLRDKYRGALPHVAELKTHFGLTANEGDDDYKVRI